MGRVVPIKHAPSPAKAEGRKFERISNAHTANSKGITVEVSTARSNTVQQMTRNQDMGGGTSDGFGYQSS